MYALDDMYVYLVLISKKYLISLWLGVTLTSGIVFKGHISRKVENHFPRPWGGQYPH